MAIKCWLILDLKHPQLDSLHGHQHGQRPLFSTSYYCRVWLELKVGGFMDYQQKNVNHTFYVFTWILLCKSYFLPCNFDSLHNSVMITLVSQEGNWKLGFACNIWSYLEFELCNCGSSIEHYICTSYYKF